MKKLFSSLVLLLSIAANCSAIAPQEIALGGIPITADVDYLEQVYGKPSKIIYTTCAKGTKYENDVPKEGFYGKTVKVSYWDTSPFSGWILGMDTTANNGFSTPAGLSVGMDEALIEKTYGRPDQFKKGGCVVETHKAFGDIKFGSERVRNCYVYRYQFPTYPCNILSLYFECADGKITRIGTRKRLDMSRG